MYPNLRYAFYDIFGLDIPLLGLVQSYGFFLAMAFICAAWWLTKEMKRQEGLGLLEPTEKTTIVGQGFGARDAIFNGLFGFLLGFKGIYILLNSSLFSADNAQEIFFSFDHGYWWGGLLVAAAFIGTKYWQKKKEQEKYPEPQELKEPIMPHQRVGDIIVTAAISGILGAKLLFLAEYPDQLKADPIGAIFSGSGLTVYGGLILGFIVVALYVRSKKIPVVRLMDIAAPAMMLSYGVGRLGCHFSGDGDWGDPNPNPNPGWLPDWMWGYKYPNNVLAQGEPLADCGYPADFGNYCAELPQAVYPTPVWEFIMAFIIFLILAFLIKRTKVPGLLFAIYLIFNGMERFMIEVIRVNDEYTILGIPMTQAQVIASIIFLVGVVATTFLLIKQRQLGKQMSS